MHENVIWKPVISYLKTMNYTKVVLQSVLSLTSGLSQGIYLSFPLNEPFFALSLYRMGGFVKTSYWILTIQQLYRLIFVLKFNYLLF